MKAKENSLVRHQILNFAFTAQNQEISKEIEIDEKFDLIEKILFFDDVYYSKTLIKEVRIDNDSTLFEEGIRVAFYQTFIDKGGIEINSKVNKKAKVKIVLKDDGIGAFSAHNAQVALVLKQAE